MSSLTYYEILGVRRTATVEQIRLAYRELAKSLHPDVSPNPDAQGRFTELSRAYQILSDRAQRERYDQALREHSETRSDGSRRAHYTWTNIATERAAPAQEPTDFDELYETFFRPHPPREQPPAARPRGGGT